MSAVASFDLPIGLKDTNMQKTADSKKQKCKNCEGKGTLKKGDKVVRCQRCGGSGIKR
jgi:DnaJ-class molecular chaperone